MDRSYCVIRVAERDVYGLAVEHAEGLRLRLPTPVWEDTELVAGMTVEVVTRNDPAKRYLIASVLNVRDLQFTWVSFAPPIIEFENSRLLAKQMCLLK